MDEESWAAVCFNILLDGDLLGDVLIAFEWSVKESESESHSPEDEEFHDWPVDIEKHSSNEGWSNIIEPNWVEIAESSFEEWHVLFRQVSIAEEEEDSSIEELNNEDTVGNESGLFWFSILSNVNDKLNDEKSEHIIDSNDDVLDWGSESKTSQDILNVFFANWNLVVFWLLRENHIHNSNHSNGSLLSCAETLERASKGSNVSRVIEVNVFSNGEVLNV